MTKAATLPAGDRSRPGHRLKPIARVAVVVPVLVLAACSSGRSATPPPSTTPSTTAHATATPTTAPLSGHDVAEKLGCAATWTTVAPTAAAHGTKPVTAGRCTVGSKPVAVETFGTSVSNGRSIDWLVKNRGCSTTPPSPTAIPAYIVQAGNWYIRADSPSTAAELARKLRANRLVLYCP